LTQTKYNILDYILQQTGAKPKRQGDKILLDPCPLCKTHKGHFYVYPKSNSYYSFSGCCKGGTIVDWLIEHDGLSLAEAMKQVHGEAPPLDKQKDDETKRLAKLLNDNVESFFHAIVDKFKLMVRTEESFKRLDIPWENPYYRWVRQGVRFYDRVTTEFIEGDYAKRVRLMRNHKDEYFFKLAPGVVVTIE